MARVFKKCQVDLYDLCTVIDEGNCATLASIADRLNVSKRTIERKLKRLRRLGIEVEIEEYYEDDEERVRHYYLVNDINEAKERLDDLTGLWSASEKSSLSDIEKQEVIKIYLQVLESNNGKSPWPPFYFSDKKKRAERLRVIIPYALENILRKKAEEVTREDLVKIKLGEAITYCLDYYRLLKLAYPWLEREEEVIEKCRG